MTSIEWLISELEKVNYHPTEAMVMYAKKLHKQECIKFYVKGCEDTYGMDEGTDDKKDAEDYYNEQFKKD
jgi:hypothetical protein